MAFWFYSAVTRSKVLIFFAHSSVTCVFVCWYVGCTPMHVVCIYMFKFKYVWYMCIPLCILMWRVCLYLKAYHIPHQWLPQAKEACSAVMILGFMGLLSILFKCIMLRASCVLPVDTGVLCLISEARESPNLSKRKAFPGWRIVLLQMPMSTYQQPSGWPAAVPDLLLLNRQEKGAEALLSGSSLLPTLSLVASSSRTFLSSSS